LYAAELFEREQAARCVADRIIAAIAQMEKGLARAR
jgi:hypothetical protein